MKNSCNPPDADVAQQDSRSKLAARTTQRAASGGERTYQVVVNAQTGELQGQRPRSWLKIALSVLLLGTLGAGPQGSLARRKKRKLLLGTLGAGAFWLTQ